MLCIKCRHGVFLQRVRLPPCLIKQPNCEFYTNILSTQLYTAQISAGSSITVRQNIYPVEFQTDRVYWPQDTCVMKMYCTPVYLTDESLLHASTLDDFHPAICSFSEGRLNVPSVPRSTGRTIQSGPLACKKRSVWPAALEVIEASSPFLQSSLAGEVM